jgi:hypothetical protein
MGHMLRGNCLLKHNVEEKIEGKAKGERRLNKCWLNVGKRENN